MTFSDLELLSKIFNDTRGLSAIAELLVCFYRNTQKRACTDSAVVIKAIITANDVIFRYDS